jgi:D-lactate dehydrogenase
MTSPSASAEPFDAYFYEAFAEEAERLLEHAAAAGLRVGHTSKTIQETDHTSPPAPIISVRTQSILPTEWAPDLKGLLSRSTGYDHLTAYRAALGENSPALGYLPTYCVRAVAEQAMLLWTSLFRRLPRQLAQFDSFERDNLSGLETPGKVMALFGVGNIGYEIWKIATALGIEVLGVDPVRKHDDVTYIPADNALARADLIVCAMNLTPENHAYFTTERLALTKRSPILVNIARGEFTPALVLEEALAEGVLSGVALDAYNEESTLAPALRTGKHTMLTEDNEALLRLRPQPNVLLTPHNSFNTLEAVERKSEQSIRALLHFRQAGEFLWPLPEA